KSYGGAYIVMDSKTMGNDLAMAWPSAEIAVMGAKGAVEILHRTASAEERVEIETDYEARLLNPYVAAERGSIDMVIDPADTRRQIAEALDLLATKRERLPRRRHDNSPL
ncbi:methylmalonyl-CoA carboxyltransferase, partial [Acidimicrobiales bacterium]|nr:methylmalonyl-CoA carboxyltransferase [Acidimicrobiales bacterium]